ncbi:50S ribosomal protein L31e [Desulfurococcus mucosus]|uniref:Large ribosomal subunit protein eL31 n=1 Tax=Desulfurococcus mucosus (strain ATCC 35584 / DSM 2162 / JCM 9187 / O7/1) TaxID=765177 RepID=E8RAB3_DESM0|nr:50S ribosomal protein L31e [Desulfurococcus mucosus]ADV65419.1 LSU ribosomal protein L31E [Desulfurococcus mucosus DSM 2162]
MSETGSMVKSTHVIPLGRVYFGRRMNRADRAVRLVKKYVARHFKDAEKIIVDPLLNKYIWSRGREKPPRRVVVEVRFDKESKEARVFLKRLKR